MKAVRVHSYHQRPTVDDIPEPKIEGPLDVIVKIGGAGLCRTDLHIIEGQWASRSNVELPYVIGHENAGWIAEVGPAVTNVKVGDGVILHPFISCGLCLPCRGGNDMHCENGAFPGIAIDGGMAEYIKTSARSVVKLDPSLEPADVAALADAGLTAYHAVRKSVPLLYPGTTAVVIGAGGLGHIGIQSLTAITGTRVVVVDPNEAALALAKELGAHETVKGGEGAVQQILDLTGGKGADVVFDYVGEAGAEKDAWQMTKPSGSHYVIGYGGNVDVETIDLISSERNIVGNLVGTYNDLAELMALAAAGSVKLHTTKYSLADVNKAMDDLEAGTLRGRGILIP
jgi:NAD+-dependent secondary alcohol dehydrogenase Adh1